MCTTCTYGKKCLIFLTMCSECHIHKFHILPTCSVYLCILYVWTRDQIAIIFPYIVNCLVFIIDTELCGNKMHGQNHFKSIQNVYSAVRTYLLTNLVHGADSFSRRYPILTQSTNSPRFMEPEGSLPRLQEPATSPYSEPDQASPFPPIPLPEDPSPPTNCP